jgi:predicted metal-dependent hydrolase
LKHWLTQRARLDVQEIAADYAKRFGLVPRSIRVVEMSHGCGSCGPECNVLINWHLILAPRKVLEYVVAHEPAHLRVRSQGSELWTALGQVLQDFDAPKAWLARHQSLLTGDFPGSR